MKKFIASLLAFTAISPLSAQQSDIENIEVERGSAIVYDNVKPLAETTSKDGKYSLSIGGNINLKASSDFNGSIDYLDFIPSMISVPATYDNERRFRLDATTSRVEVKAKADTQEFGDVELCLNMDFRGGSVGSYMPRVRLAYITMCGFLVGRNFTTFADMGSLAPNIDFQGPNVCPFIYTTQIRYQRELCNNRFKLGGAIEYLDYQSSTLGTSFTALDQYMPDFIGYMQYNWANDHIRLTGLYKSIPLYNVTKAEDFNLNGWGSQVSGSIGISPVVKLYYSATCGEGITNYLQDIYGSGLDATVATNNGVTSVSMTFMYGWQSSILVELSKKTMVSSGYSVVNVEGDRARFADSDYRRGEYLFANIFYSLSSRIQLSAEYLWGSRENFNTDRNTANRIYTMVQYNF